MFAVVNRKENKGTLMLGLEACNKEQAERQGRVFILAMKAVASGVKNAEKNKFTPRKDIFIDGLVEVAKMPRDVATCVLETLVDMGLLTEKDGVLASVVSTENVGISDGKVVGQIGLN